MNYLVRLMVSMALLAELVSAQQAPPPPAGTPEPQFRPDLLPESTVLPVAPPNLGLPSPSVFKPAGTDPAQTEHAVIQLSPEDQQKNRVRLSETRAVAMRNPRVIDLMQEANGALSDEARREFMRAYYHTLCNQMRKLEPGLAGPIAEYEQAQIRQLAQGSSRLAIASREPKHRKSSHQR
jgi:hypothetical protein